MATKTTMICDRCNYREDWDDSKVSPKCPLTVEVESTSAGFCITLHLCGDCRTLLVAFLRKLV